jgi:hypothetical protein
MYNATGGLGSLLATLSAVARRRGLSDSGWAALAGLRKETLSRLRGRRSCDFATLEALARVVGTCIDLRDPGALPADGDGHFPAGFDRDDEQLLLELAVARDFDPGRWLRTGPRFFMAGFAVMLASLRGLDRHGFLALAERLHPGSSHPGVFSLWLERSPLQPSRFVPQLEGRLRYAA